MRRCPITYEICNDHYSLNGLKALSPKLNQLNDFPYGKERQLELAFQYSDKLSFSGVQPKLNAKLNINTANFEVVGAGGTFIVSILSEFQNCIPFWKELVSVSFLSQKKKDAYLALLEERTKRLLG